VARRKNGKLASSDSALFVLWPESTVLIPVRNTDAAWASFQNRLTLGQEDQATLSLPH